MASKRDGHLLEIRKRLVAVQDIAKEIKSKKDPDDQVEDMNDDVDPSHASIIVKETQEALNELELLEKNLHQEKSSNQWTIAKVLTSVFSPPKNLQVYTPFQTTTTVSFCGWLRQSMEKMNITIEVKTEESVPKTGPVLVICPLTSRLQVDMDYALKDINRAELVAVIALHIVRDGWQPTVSTSSRLWESYKNIDFIDMAFDPDKKVFKCIMNSEAKRKLKSISSKI